MKSMYFAGLYLITLFAMACSHPPPGKGAGEIESSPQSQTSFKVETVVENLQVPWSIVWAPDGRMIFTERPGRVRVYENGRLRPEPLFVVPDVEPKGESGLMSIALHPQFASNHLLYLSYAYSANGQQVRVVRYRETPNGFTDRKVIVENIPAARLRWPGRRRRSQHPGAWQELRLAGNSSSRNSRRHGIAGAGIHARMRAGERNVLSWLAVSAVQEQFFLWLSGWDANYSGST